MEEAGLVKHKLSLLKEMRGEPFSDPCTVQQKMPPQSGLAGSRPTPAATSIRQGTRPCQAQSLGREANPEA